MTKEPLTIAKQIDLLKSRGMLFRDEESVSKILINIGYYRLKGYWWDMQSDRVNHRFIPGSCFEEVLERYNFDRNLRLILFDAIERIEIALRTKMIYYLSLAYGATWYLERNLFDNPSLYDENMNGILRELEFTQEIFIKDHKLRHPNDEIESWKIMEIVSMGTLSKLFKNLHHQLPEKTIIAREMGLNLHSELASWLESIVYIRNIIAHHSRLWSRNMVKIPVEQIKNPTEKWFNKPLADVQKKKSFLIISAMIYLCGKIEPGNSIKSRILELIKNNSGLPVYKLGFLNNWNQQPIWKDQ